MPDQPRDPSPPSTTPTGTSTAERLERALAGRYTITRELARGGMGTVFLASDAGLPAR
jgi:hypothetical protein